MSVRAFVAAALLLSSCAEAKPIDFAAAETWLGPEEAKTGRKLSFSGRSDIYIGTAKGCVLPKTYDIRGSLDTSRWDPAWLHLHALFKGSAGNGDNLVGPPLQGSIALVMKYHYRMQLIQPSLDYFSILCSSERGELKDKSALSRSPSNVRIYVHAPDYKPELDQAAFAGLEPRIFEFSRKGRTYCRIRLGVSGSDIKQSRIDVLTSANVVPQFSDAEAMDCITRGVIASVGYLGILRYEFDELYHGLDFPPPDKPFRISESGRTYITPLLAGFSHYIESRILW